MFIINFRIKSIVPEINAKNIVFWIFGQDLPLKKISKNRSHQDVHFDEKKFHVPSLSWELWQFKVFFCKLLPPGGREAEN